MPSKSSTDIRSAALEYVERGWPVIALHSPRGPECSCGDPGCSSPGKHPRTPNGLKDATTDEATVRQWFTRWPDANVGLLTGVAFDVLDADGQEGLHELEQAGKLPPCPTVITGHGGHFYVKPTGVGGKVGIAPGLDWRGRDAYVVAPPSRHINGRDYRWANGTLEPLEAPQWLKSMLAERPRESAPAVGDVIPEGRRDAELASIAGTMRRRGLTEPELLAALKEVNRLRCRPPLGDRQVGKIAASIANYPAATDSPVDGTVEPRLQPLSTKELATLPAPDRSEELLGSLLTRGQRVVIGAHTGHGKTTLALQACRAFAHSEAFLDYKGAGGRALVIDAEQSLRTIKRRIAEAELEDSESVHYLRVPDGLELDQDDDQARALEAVFAEGGFDVVVADPLYKLHGGDSNDERSAVDLMKLFDGWREQYGFCLLLPVHCRKPPVGAKFSMHEFFGSSAYLRGAEVVLGLQLLRPDYSRLHFFKDRDGDLPLGEAWGLLFDRGSGYRRDPDDGKPKATAADKIAELLEVDPGMTIAQLIEASGYAERTVKDALKALKAVGASGPRNLKQWRLPLETDE